MKYLNIFENGMVNLRGIASKAKRIKEPIER